MKEAANQIRRIDLLKIVEKKIVENQSQVLDLNTSQLYSGIDSKGQSLGEYRPFTVRLKRAKGQPTDRVTLKDEGDFYQGFRLEDNKFPFDIGSTDSKSDMLADKYGDDIFGLTKDSNDEIIEQILPEVQDEFLKAIQRSFKSL